MMNAWTSTLCLTLTMMFGAAHSSCKVDEIPVKQDFDMTKMYGAWYETHYAPSQWEKPEWVWNDFVEVWSATEGDPNTVSVMGYGRPINETKCGNFTKMYKKSQKEGEKDVPAKWYSYQYINESYSIPIDTWIIGTDYTSWMLVYGCTIRNDATGQCDHVIGWVWSRDEQKLTDAAKAAITDLLPSICITWSDLKTMPVTGEKECERDSGETGGSTQVCATTPLVVISLLFFLGQ